MYEHPCVCMCKPTRAHGRVCVGVYASCERLIVCACACMRVCVFGSAAFNQQRAKNQNATIGVSFGSTRELAFLHAKDPSMKLYFPQTNGMLFYFGRDVNIKWKHGVNAIPETEQDGKGRISIILWGWVEDTVDEANSPPMLTNDSRQVYDGRRHNNRR